MGRFAAQRCAQPAAPSRGNDFAVHTFPGKNTKGARGGHALFEGRCFPPHEVGQLNQKHTLWVQQVQVVQVVFGGEDVERIQADAEVGAVGRINNLPGLREAVHRGARV